MWTRLAAERLRTLARRFPSVLILGARQVGKTTLARQTFPAHAYVDLEEPATRLRFQDEPTFQLERSAARPVILGCRPARRHRPAAPPVEPALARRR